MSGVDEIIAAIGDNDWEMFQRAVLNTKNLNDRDDGGWTPLGLAAFYGRKRMVKELIRRGALVNYADKYGSRPVHMAALEGYTELVRVLVELKADAHKANSYGWTPLQAAAYNGHMAIVKCLVEECHTEINTRNYDGDTPISYAKHCRHKDVVIYLEQQLIVKQVRV